MIEFGIESKLYKISSNIYNVMKINLMVFIFSFTIVGLGSAISSGFYELNQVYKKGNNANFKRFFKEFKGNFRKSLFFSAPILFLIYSLFKKFGYLIVTNNYYKYSYIVAVILLVSYMFTLLIVVGLVDMSVKNSLIYAGILYIKQLVILIFSTMLMGFLFKFMLFRYPVVLIVCNFMVPIVIYYGIFQDLINRKMYLQGEDNE